MFGMKRQLLAVCVIAALFVLPYADSAAQQPRTVSDHRATVHSSDQRDSTWGALDGSVRDTSGASLVGVEVVAVDNPNARARTGAGGAFRIDSIKAGPHLIRFRRIGIVPLTVSVVVQPNTTTSVDAIVAPMTVVLARITVQAPSGELLSLPSGVADRARNGIGHFITAAQIAKQSPRETGDLFRRIAGLQVSGLPGREYVSNTRGTTVIFDAIDDNGAHKTTTNCSKGMSVFVDGAPSDSNIDNVAPGDIEAIEIYKDPVETPVTLPQSPCGLIYIWTK
jgi:hypothetical protein